MALLIPESFIADSEFLKGIIVEAVRWIPAVNNVAAISDFPMVTGLYLTVMWIAMPFAVWWWLVNMPMRYTSPSLSAVVRLLIMNTVFLALLATIFYWFPAQPNAHDLSFHGGRSGLFLGTVAHFKLGLGLLLGAAFYVLSLFLMAWLRTIWLCSILLFRLVGISL